MAQQGEVGTQPGSPAANAETMTIKVKTMEPNCYELLVERNITVPALKVRLTQYVDAQPERQRLIFKGRGLRDDQTLADIGIEDGDALHLVIRPVDAPPLGSQTEPTPSTRNVNSGGNINMGAGVPLVNLGPLLQGLLGGMGGMISQAGGVMQVPGMQGGMAMAAGAAGGGPQQPHVLPPNLMAAVSHFLTRLPAPDFQTTSIPLSSQISPEILASMDHLHTEFTSVLRDILANTELPENLRELMEASASDPLGRLPAAQAPTAAATAAAAAADTGGAAAAGADAAEAPLATDAPPVTSAPPAAAAGVPLRQLIPSTNYRYTPLAVAAFAELTRRSEAAISSALSASMRESSTSLIANAASTDRQQLAEHHVRPFAGQLHAFAALLTELARLASCLLVALDGNTLPLVSNSAAVMRGDGSAAAFPRLLPGLPSPGMGPGGMPPAGALPQEILNMLSNATLGGATAAVQMPGAAGQMPPGSEWMQATFTAQMGPDGQPVFVPVSAQGGPSINVSGTMGQHRAAGAATATAQGTTGQPVPPMGGAPGGPMPGGIPGGPVPGPMPGMPFSGGNIQFSPAGIHIDMSSVPINGLGAALGPIMQMFSSGSAGGVNGAAGGPVDPAALIASMLAGLAPQPVRQPQDAGRNDGEDGSQGDGSGQQRSPQQEQGGSRDMSGLIRTVTPLLETIARNVSSNVLQRLSMALPPPQGPQAISEAVGQIVSQVLNETLSNTLSMVMQHGDRLSAGIHNIEEGVGEEVAFPELLQQVSELVASVLYGAPPQAAAAPAAAAATATAAAANPPPSDSVPSAAPATAERTPAPTPVPASAPPAQSREASISEPLPAHASTAAPALSVAPAATATASSAAAATPGPAEGPSSSNPPPTTYSTTAGPSTAAGPKGLGGLKPMPLPPKKKVATAGAASGGTDSSRNDSATQPPAPGSRAGQARAGSGPAAAGAPPDLSSLMAMLGGAPPGSAVGAPRGGSAGPPDMSGLMSMMGQMMGGGGGPGGGGRGPGGAGGMGGLLQMASSLASDPSMQPMMESMMSSMMGGGGPPGGSGRGGAGGMGGLLSSLMGGLSNPQSGGSRGGPGGNGQQRASVEEVVDFDVLDELGPEEAARWRSVIEADEQLMRGASARRSEVRSEVYRAGAASSSTSANLLHSLGGGF